MVLIGRLTEPGEHKSSLNEKMLPVFLEVDICRGIFSGHQIIVQTLSPSLASTSPNLHPDITLNFLFKI